MPSSSKELKNIPVSISILHEQEYNNLYLLMKPIRGKVKKRRAFSERSSDKESDEPIQFKLYEYSRRKTLKN
jgi:hypothetical protein